MYFTACTPLSGLVTFKTVRVSVLILTHNSGVATTVLQLSVEEHVELYCHYQVDIFVFCDILLSYCS